MELIGAVVMVGVFLAIFAVVWQDVVNEYGITYWQLLWRTAAVIGLMSLFIELVAKPFGLGG